MNRDLGRDLRLRRVVRRPDLSRRVKRRADLPRRVKRRADFSVKPVRRESKPADRLLHCCFACAARAGAASGSAPLAPPLVELPPVSG